MGEKCTETAWRRDWQIPQIQQPPVRQLCLCPPQHPEGWSQAAGCGSRMPSWGTESSSSSLCFTSLPFQLHKEQPPTPLRGLYSLCLKRCPWHRPAAPLLGLRGPSLHPPCCYTQGAGRPETCCLKTRLGEEERESSPKGKAISWNKISTTTRFLTFSTVVS